MPSLATARRKMAWSSIEQNWKQFSPQRKAEVGEAVDSTSPSFSACHKPIDWNLAKNAKALDQVHGHKRRRLFASSTLIVVVGTCVHAEEHSDSTLSVARIGPRLPHPCDECIPIFPRYCRGHLVAQGLLDHCTIILSRYRTFRTIFIERALQVDNAKARRAQRSAPPA